MEDADDAAHECAICTPVASAIAIGILSNIAAQIRFDRRAHLGQPVEGPRIAEPLDRHAIRQMCRRAELAPQAIGMHQSLV